MLIADVENPNKKHYVAVKSLSRLLSKQNSKHKEAQHFCNNCLDGFESEIIRDEHYEYCRSKDSVRVEMSTKNPIVKYVDGQYQFKVPFVIYADTESISVPVSGVPNNPEMSSTRGINVHQPSGWCMYPKFAYGNRLNKFQQYRGRDCIGKFCDRIMTEAKRFYESAPKKPMEKLTKEQDIEFITTKECHICFKKFSIKDRKVRDHCHYTGKYRGAAHSSCNLRYRIPDYIPVVFHNLAGYDAHLFIKELAKHTTKIGVIAKNTENYISFSVKVEVDKSIDKAGNEKSKEIELRFIDSFKFMSGSLDSLVNNLAKGGHEFWEFEKYNSEQKELLIRKGVYPYEYMDSWDKFEEKRLPSMDKFYSKYPRELHDHHNDLPFMCEKIRVNGIEKLVPNLHDKKKYVIHVKALKQALDHGLVLEKIHRVIQFKQSAWMKKYIDFNTRLRMVAKNDFEKDFYKLMNNSVFGKTIENIRRHRDIRLVNNKEDYLK